MSNPSSRKSWLGSLFSSSGKNSGEDNRKTPADDHPEDTVDAESDKKAQQAGADKSRDDNAIDHNARLDSVPVHDIRLEDDASLLPDGAQADKPTKPTKPTSIMLPEKVTEKNAAKESWLKRLGKGLARSATVLSDGLGGIFAKSKLDDDTLEELEDLLITADLGVGVASRLTYKLAAGKYDREISVKEVKTFLVREIETILAPVAKPLEINPENKPHVILMTGVNGAGKTTTIGKLAKQYKKAGKSVMLAAADTFRAAAIEQLKAWGERSGVPVVSKAQGSDAAAVAFEAVEKAVDEGIDVLIIDTAGRLQNREELMAELGKIVRVIGRKIDGAPHDTLIVLDATTGQNALGQVEAFRKTAAISGLVMTKLDGSARGGVLVAVADKFGLPIHAIGVGEHEDDLQAFHPGDFARSLIGTTEKGQL